MMHEVKRVRLGDVTRMFSGATPFKGNAEYWVGDIPWVSAKDMKLLRLSDAEDHISQEGLDKGSRMAPVGSTLILTRGMTLMNDVPICKVIRPLAFNQDLKALVPTEAIDGDYLLYVLLSLKPVLLNMVEQAGHGTGKLASELLKALELRLPALPVQRTIAQVLSALDDKIALNRRMNATLEAMAQAVFKEWFVEGNARGRGMKGWEVKTISDLAKINAWSLGKNDALDVIDYIEISEVNRGDIGKIERYARGEEPGRAKRRLRSGDTVMSTVRPDRGAYFLSLDPAESLIASSGFAVITPTKAPWSYIHAALTQLEVFDYLGQQADGGAYPAVRPEIIGAYPVAWPNDQKVLDRFHAVVVPLYERAEQNRKESRTLTALRDTLLPKLMRGEVRVKEAIDQ